MHYDPNNSYHQGGMGQSQQSQFAGHKRTQSQPHNPLGAAQQVHQKNRDRNNYEMALYGMNQNLQEHMLGISNRREAHNGTQ